MWSRKAALACLLAFTALARAARGDTLELVGGRIDGRIVEETEERIVLRQGKAELTFPSDAVRRIHRDDGTSRDLAAERGEVARLMDACATPGLPADDVRSLRERIARHERQGTVAAWLVDRAGLLRSSRDCEAALGCLSAVRTLTNDGLSGVDSLERAIRLEIVERALAARDVRKAREAIAPLVDRDPHDTEVASLDARIVETDLPDGPARDACWRVLQGEGLTRVAGQPLEVLRELARRATSGRRDLLRAFYAQASRGSGFRLAETRHVSVFAPPADLPSKRDLETLEAGRLRVLARLGLGESDVAPRVVVYILDSRERFLEATGCPTWAAGCACCNGDGRRGAVPSTIATFESENGGLMYAFEHELAHTFVADTFDERLPDWATEGVACYAEPETSRSRLRARGGRGWPFSRLFSVKYWELPGEEATVFYAESAALFERLVEREGSVRAALRVASAQRDHDAASSARIDALEKVVANDLSSAAGAAQEAARVDEPSAESASLASKLASRRWLVGLGLVLFALRRALVAFAGEFVGGLSSRMRMRRPRVDARNAARPRSRRLAGRIQ